MKKFSSIMLIVLSVAMILSMAACGGNENPKTNPVSGNQGTAPVSSAEKSYLPDSYPAIDGMEFNILTRDGDSGYWAVMDLTAAESNDEPINDAVFERNAYLESKYGFKINQIYDEVGDHAALVTKIENVNKAGTETYHAVAVNAMYTAGPLAKSNNLVDLKTISTLDLEYDFWNQRFIENMSIGNKLFALTGDLTVTYHDVAWIQLFNKDLLEEKGIDEEIGNPYDFVNEGTWTLEVMDKMGTMAKEDLNGDGKMGATDRFGYAYAPFNNYALYYAGGNQVLGKDENDLPVLTVYSTQAVETVEKIKEMINNKDSNRSDYGAPNVKIFNEGRSLFVNAQMMGVRTDHRGVEFDFGILPTPKIDASQEDYTNVVSMSATVYAIPTSCQAREETGFLLNALAYQSKDTLIPAYFDTTFEIVTRDPESEETLNKILDASYFDLSFMYEVGWLVPLMNDMATLELASRYDSLKDSSQAIIDEIIESVNKTE